MKMELDYIRDWEENVDMQNDPPDLVEGVIAATHEANAVTGRSEIGKTNFLLNLAYSLATGTPFLGFEVPKQFRVAYIGFEGNEKKMRDRQSKIKENFPDPLGNLWVKFTCPMFKLTGERIGQFQDMIKGMDVVIIDPIRYIVPGDYLDCHKSTQFLETLEKVMMENKSTCIFTWYHKKMDKNTLLDSGDLWSMKGATEWGDMCATVLMLEKTKQKSIGGRGSGQGFQPVNKDNATLYFAKTRNAIDIQQPIELCFNREKCMHERIQTQETWDEFLREK